MWVVIRFVLASIGFVIRLIYRNSGGGEQMGEYEGVPYFIIHKTHKGKTRKYWVGMPLQAPTWIRMHRETAFDRLCKRIGISNEVWTGDERFDDTVYVTCDHPFVGKLLAQSAELRAAVLAAFDAGFHVRYDGSFVWIVDAGKTQLRGHPALVDAIRRASAPLEAQLPSRFGDPFLWKAFVIEGVIWAIAGYAIGAYAQLTVQDESVHLSAVTITLLGIGFAILLFAVLVGGVVLFMRHSSRGHRVVVESAAVLAIALPFTGIQLASDTNRVLDDTEPVVMEQVAGSCKVVERRGRRRKSYKYYLIMAKPEPPIPDEIRVSKAVCDSVTRAMPVRITLGHGFWGVAWYRRIETGTVTWMP